MGAPSRGTAPGGTEVEDDGSAVADAIRRELSLGAGVTRYTNGSVPVFAVGDAHVVKLFPPNDRAAFRAEWAALERLDGFSAIPIPRPVAAGERGPWAFVVMTRLSGAPMDEAWSSTTPR